MEIGTDSLFLRKARAAVAACYFIPGLIFASWASRIPDIKSALALSDGELGSALFAIPVGQLGMMALSGYLTNRLGSLRMLVAGIAAYSVALTLIPLSYNFLSLFALLILFGAAANLVNISVNTQACDVENLYGRNIMSSFHGIWSLGGLSGGLIGMAFARFSPSIGIHFITVAAIGIAGLAAVTGHLVADPQPTAGERPQGSLLSRIDSVIILLGFTAFAGMFCEGTLFDWSGVYFATVVLPPDHLVRLGYVAGMGMMALGRFVADGFVNRHGPTPVLVASGCLITAGLLVAVSLPSIFWATTGFMLVGLGISSVVPICYSLAGHHPGMSASTAIALVSSVSFIGFMIGPPLIGLIAQTSNLRIALGCASVFGLLVSLLATRRKAARQ